MGRITVAGLGPAGPGAMTAATMAAIAEAKTIRLRTSRHPAASVVDASSFDHVYETSETFAEVYETIVEELVRLANGHQDEAGALLYLVPGAPTVAESTVDMLVADPRVEVTIVAAMSFLDLAWARLGIDPVEHRVTLVDGHDYEAAVLGLSGTALVAQCSSNAVLSDIKLALDACPESAVILHHLGLEDEQIHTVDWADIDRTLTADHLTSLYIPQLGPTSVGALAKFEQLVHQLRAECPWDADQTHGSLSRFLVEETFEAVEAIDLVESDDGRDEASTIARYAHLRDELGDVLFQVFLHSAIAEEAAQFTLGDVARGVHDKLVGRHPHVFDPDNDQQLTWDELKALERTDAPGERSLDGIPPLPSLQHAAKITSTAAKAGFRWPGAEGAWSKVSEEIDELKAAETSAEVQHEFGDVLFALVALAPHLGVEADGALRAAITRFRSRFEYVERGARDDGLDLDALGTDELLRRWALAKLHTGH
jgi:tetrapyrrole methylase family protein/MazG family protein